LKAELAETGPYAPVGERKERERERKEVEEKKTMEVLEEQLGPLLPTSWQRLRRRGSERVGTAEEDLPADGGEGIPCLATVAKQPLSQELRYLIGR